jgi:hypothetical protein
MVVREHIPGKIRSGMEHFRWLGWVALGMGLMFLAMRWDPPLQVDSILVAYPYEERSLIVERSGYAELSMRGVKLELRRGSFDVDDLFQLLMFYWEPLRQGEPAAQDMGTVRVFYNNHTSGTYFIYDTVYLEALFTEAQANAGGDS